MKISPLLLLAALAATPAALAQEAPVTDLSTGETADAGTRWTLGLGAVAFPDYQGSQDYTAAPLWNIRAQNLYHPDTYVQLFGPILTSNLIPDSHFRLGPMAQYIRKRGNVQNDEVDDMQNVDPSFMLGAIVGYDFKLGEQRNLALDFLGRQDVANDNGFLGTLQATYRMPLGERWRSSLGVETTWASSDYMSSYFGVDADDAARSGLDEYDTDSGFKDVGANASLSYLITPHWDVTGIAAYRRLVDDAEDSPVTKEGSANQWYGGLLFNYHF
jgi:outer membrane scaffolding protein for murein synthesis (MipA/OmpV family)